jgi:hypothetical protein
MVGTVVAATAIASVVVDAVVARIPPVVQTVVPPVMNDLMFTLLVVRRIIAAVSRLGDSRYSDRSHRRHCSQASGGAGTHVSILLMGFPVPLPRWRRAGPNCNWTLVASRSYRPRAVNRRALHGSKHDQKDNSNCGHEEQRDRTPDERRPGMGGRALARGSPHDQRRAA